MARLGPTSFQQYVWVSFVGAVAAPIRCLPYRRCRPGWPSPSQTARVAARFLPVGLSVGVAISSASPSESKDGGTRYGAPSAEALATQTSLSWVSRPPAGHLRTPGQADDAPMMLPLLAHLRVQRTIGRPRTRPDRALADKAYSSHTIRARLRARGIGSVIREPEDQNAHRKRIGSSGDRPVTHDRTGYRGRSVIERAFKGFKHWRGLATRYDKHAIVYCGGLVLAAVLLGLTDLGDTAWVATDGRDGGRRAQMATALAAAMFRESTPPAIGILTTKSAPWIARRESPSPSVPKTIASRSGWSVARSPG